MYDAYDKPLKTLTDLPDTSIDETKDLDGTVNCKLVTQGHDAKEIVLDVFKSGWSVLRGTKAYYFSSEDEALERYYIAENANEKLMTVLYQGDTLEVPCAKIKYTWHGDSDTNYCYASASGVGTAVLVGSIALDVALEILSAGSMTQVAVGIGVFAVSYYSTHSTVWPGHAGTFWSS